MESGKTLPTDILVLSTNEGVSLDERVRACTKALALFIDKLQSRHIAFTPAELTNMLGAIRYLIGRIAENFTGANVYHHYFLDRVDQYNFLFLEVRSTSLTETSALLKILKHLKLEPIAHPLVGSSINTKLTYCYGKPEDAPLFGNLCSATHEDGIKRYYFDQDQASTDYQGTGDTFEALCSANSSAIALCTKKTNMLAFLRPTSTTQSADSFWRPRDKEAQKIEKRLFRSAKVKLRQGEELTSAELKVMEAGEFHRSTGSSVAHHFNLANDKATHFHAGHGSQDINVGSLIISINPNYYNSDSAKRHTEAGKTTRDCFAHVICYTNERYDLLDEQTVKEAYTNLDPLFIAPAGAAALLRKWGFKNVADIHSLSEFVEIGVKNCIGEEKGKVTVYPFLSNSPSHREMNPDKADINVSLALGFMFHHENADHLTLVVDGTMKLVDWRMDCLEKFLIHKKLTISSACITAGYDRPRSLMNRPSSADAIAFHARLNIINAKVVAARRVKNSIDEMTVTQDDLTKYPCKAVFIQHGTFRHGLLNHNDVEGAITRMMAVLDHYDNNATIDSVLENLNSHQTVIKQMMNAVEIGVQGVIKETLRNQISNFAFVAMDDFERKGMIDTLTLYSSLPPLKNYLIHTFLRFLSSCMYLPRSGELYDFNWVTKGFEYDYHRLIVNCDHSHTIERAYEYVVRHVNRQFFDILNGVDNEYKNRQLVKFLFNIYQDKSSYKFQNKKDSLKSYIDGLVNMKEEEVVSSLALLQGNIKGWKTTDEVQRDEGHFETIILIAYGLLKNNMFKNKFVEDCKRAHPDLIMNRPRH